MIDQLKPGRELDALIAEKVMGCQVAQDSETGDFVQWEPAYTEALGHGFYERHGRVPNYSTDISAAWAVITHLYEQLGCEHAVTSWDEGGAQVHFHTPNHSVDVMSRSDTVAHAICLAALKAVEP